MNPLERGVCIIGKIMGAVAELLPEPCGVDDDRIVDDLGGEADEPQGQSYYDWVTQAERAVRYGTDLEQAFPKDFSGYNFGSNPNDLWTPASTTAIIESLVEHHPTDCINYIRCHCKQKFFKWPDWREHVAPLIAAHLSATVIP